MRKCVDSRKNAVSSQRSAISEKSGQLSAVSRQQLGHQLKDLRLKREVFRTLRKSKMRDFRGLRVWEKAHQLTLAVYKATLVFPKAELYGLTSQIRCASMSIPANIAEGCGRSGEAELARFLQIAMGSASELEYHLILAKELDLLSSGDYDRLRAELIDVKRMLTGLIQKLKADR